MNRLMHSLIVSFLASLLILAPASAQYYVPGPNGFSASSASSSSLASIMLKSSAVGRGSTATNRHRYQTVISNTGGIFTHTDTAVDATYIQVSETGWFHVSASAPLNGGIGVKVNSVLNNNYGVTDTDLFLSYATFATNGSISGFVYVTAGDYIWVCTNGGLAAYPEMSRLTITGPH